MAIQYDRDDARRLVILTGRGTFETREILQVIDRQRAEGVWGYGLLYDLRRTTGHPGLSDLRDIMSKVASYAATERRRGPVALLTTDPDFYGAACAYAALGRSRLRIEVFRELEDATAWLAAETSP
jgi:hypothetical protein